MVPVFDSFITRYEDSYLQLYVSKTKEMLTDSGFNPSATAPTLISGAAVETASQHKYSGTF